jgi:dTMP kinase
MFISLEGVEGSGKSTQATRLTARLRAAGRRVRQTREPGGTPFADAVRALLLHPEAAQSALGAAGLTPAAGPDNEAVEAVLPATELLLLAAARAQHVPRIRAWLAAGEVVISDRYADATRAYQGYGRDLASANITTIEHLATGGLRPDITLLLDVPAEEGYRRKWAAHAAGGEWNRLDGEAIGFHERVRAGYLALAAAEPERWTVLDATVPVDDLAEALWAAVAPRLATA